MSFPLFAGRVILARGPDEFNTFRPHGWQPGLALVTVFSARLCAASCRGGCSMIRTMIWLMVLFVEGSSIQAAPARGAAPSGRYAVVVRQEVADGPWGRVVHFL